MLDQEAQSTDSIVQKIKSQSLSSINKLMKDALKPGNHEKCMELLRAIFLGWESRPELSEVVSTLYKMCLKFVQDTNVRNSFVMDLTDLLNHEAIRLPPSELVELCSIMLTMIHNGEVGDGKWLKIFTKIVKVVELHSSVRYEKSEEVVSGAKYKKYIVRELCSYRWPTESVVNLANMFKDIKLESDEIDSVLLKLLDQLHTIDSQQLPPYVYQLLGLSSNCGKVEIALLGVLKHFVSLDEKLAEEEHSMNIDSENSLNMSVASTNELRSVEGTVLLYISNTVRQNHALGKGLMKILKSAKETLSHDVMSPFFIALGLVLAQDSRYNEETQTLVRLIINKSCQDKHKMQKSKWLQEVTKFPPNVKDILLKVVKNCRNGWEYVLSGIVDLGFNLMSCYGPKPGAFGRSMEREIAKLHSPRQECCDIGLTLLAATFKTHHITRKDIIQRVIDQIQSSSDMPAYHFIRLLKEIIKTYPYAFQQCINQLKALLEEMYMMHPYNAHKLLPAIMPLVKNNSALRDSLLVVLRKLLSSRDVNCRISAATGFLLVVQNFPLSEITSLSQISSQSTQSIFSTASTQTQSQLVGSQGRKVNNELLCLEVLQTLSQHCFTQQAEVKIIIYRNLAEVVATNPRLTPYILDYLLNHLKLYYEETEDMIPPFKLSKCITASADKCVLAEPFAALLSTIHLCVYKLRTNLNEEEFEEILDNEVVENIRGIFRSLTQRMCKCELEDFQLEKNGDFSTTTKVGQRNYFTVGLVLSLYDVLIEYNASGEELTCENSDAILTLYSCVKRLQDFIQSTKSTELTSKLFNENQHQPVVLLHVSNLVYSLFFDDSIEGDAIDLLRRNDNFIKHFIHTMHNLLIFTKDHGYFPGIGGLNKKEMLSCISRVGKSTLHKFMMEKNDPCQSPVTLLCLECFHLAFSYVGTWHPDHIVQFTSDIISRDDEVSQPDQHNITMLLKRFQRLVTTYTAPDNSPLSATHRKVVAELTNLISTLVTTATNLNLNSMIEEAAKWTRKICADQKIDDTNSVKRIVHLVLQTNNLCSTNVDSIFHNICSDLRNELGSIEQNDESQSETKFRIVTEENSHVVIPVLVGHLDSVMQDMSWLISDMKGRLGNNGSKKKDVDPDDDDEVNEERRKAEGSLCGRITKIAMGLLDLAQTSARGASNLEQFVQAFTTFFTFLNIFSKYYIWIYSQGIGHIPASFEKLCKFVNSDLLQYVYSFIMHVESTQSERLGTAKAKKDGKKKSKTKLPEKIQAMSTDKKLRETKGVAKLIYSIEQHEKNLALLGRRAKVDLMRHHRLTTTRDFRIMNDAIRRSRDEEEADKDSEVDENEEPTNKRPCLQTSVV
ncbi:Fanconi anemia group I protein-like [Ciona intestinalis]